MKILIVEDDLFSQQMLESFLTDYGKCDLADNGREALAAIHRAIDDHQPYDLVCMDIMMPEMDGLEALQKIRQLEFKYYEAGLPSAKIIMITSRNMAKDMMSAFHAGCEAYITKPFTHKDLIGKLHQLGLLNVTTPNN